MFDHVELPVADRARSDVFYGAVLAALGIERTAAGEGVEFGALTLAQRPPREPLHLAFVATTREQVRAFHRAGLAAGGRDNGAPGLRPYAADYFAAYLLDPDGHNVEAVHRSDRTRATWGWLGTGMPAAGGRREPGGGGQRAASSRSTRCSSIGASVPPKAFVMWPNASR